MVQFRDFAPRLLESGFFSDSYETLRQALGDANVWIDENHIDVVNVETVVLPNIWDSGEEGTKDVDLSASGKTATTWHQFIRVWYRVAH